MIVYRSGNLTDDNFTPRPAKDTISQPGEALGDVLYAASPRTIDLKKDLVKTAFDVVQHACEMAQELCAAEDVIAKAVVDSSRVETDELTER